MATGLMQRVETNVLDYSALGGSASRGFWTKRRRTAMSMVAVMALLAGIALAYKLFEQEVPNNVVRDASNFDFVISAYDESAGETGYRAVGGAGSLDPNAGVFRQDLTVTGGDVNMFPGDTRLAHVRIQNTNAVPARDASFTVHVGKIQVFSFCLTGVDPVTGLACVTGDYSADINGSAAGNKFLSFMRLSVDKQLYSEVPIVPACDPDCGETQEYGTACASAALTSITKSAPCKLGIVRAAGSDTSGLFGADLPPGSMVPSDDREYEFRVSELDNGADQSQFKGWRVVFSLFFNARIPAEAESGRYSAVPFPLA